MLSSERVETSCLKTRYHIIKFHFACAVVGCVLLLQGVIQAGVRGLHPRAVALSRVCTTCEIVRPIRAKHDAFTG